jgi:hypothetical protein
MLAFFLNWCLGERNRRCPRYTTFLILSKYILLISPKQCVHALYPLFVYPERLLRAGQSFMVMSSNARRLNSSCLYSSHTRTPSFCHSCRSSSTNGLRYMMSHRTRWETPRGRYDEHNSKFSLSMKPKFNRPVGERNHF